MASNNAQHTHISIEGWVDNHHVGSGNSIDLYNFLFYTLVVSTLVRRIKQKRKDHDYKRTVALFGVKCNR